MSPTLEGETLGERTDRAVETDHLGQECARADGNDEIGGRRRADVLNSVLVVRMDESH